MPARRAIPMLPEEAGTHVVTDRHRHCEGSRDDVADGQVLPVQVGRPHPDAARVIDQSGHDDAYRATGCVESRDDLGHGVGEAVPQLRGSGADLVAQHPTVIADQGSLDPGPTNVDADHREGEHTYDFMAGARGVRLAEAGLQFSAEGRRVVLDEIPLSSEKPESAFQDRVTENLAAVAS